jgi:dTDP-glucose pyrophosphorylase
MENWERTLVGPEAQLRDALGVIDKAGSRMALVVDANRRLLGTLSDGDVRRGLMKGLGMTDRAAAAMHVKPTTARPGDSGMQMAGAMRRLGLQHMPIVDESGIVVGLWTLADLLEPPERKNWVVIMAGGLGTRLKELTTDTPKPMLKVGPRPLIETLMRTYIAQGFRQFYIAVNYKAEQIEDHFGDGTTFGVQVRYLKEKERMGTAGALSLLPEMPHLPLIVTNADLLAQQDYGAMLDSHVRHGAVATMAVRDYEVQVPFGVVHERDGNIDHIEEKPIQRFVVSAGIYVLSPQALSLVPAGQFTDMPTLFGLLADKGLRARSHAIDGYWLDVGRMADYERAQAEFGQVFDS